MIVPLVLLGVIVADLALWVCRWAGWWRAPGWLMATLTAFAAVAVFLVLFAVYALWKMGHM